MPKRSTYAWRPLTARDWGVLEELFGPRGACGGCWCMVWRSPSRKTFEEGQGEENRAAFKRIAAQDPSPGVLLFAPGDDRAVGWCSVGPRAAFPALERSRVLKPLDDVDVWSITCFYVRKDHRRQGLMVELLHAAAGYVKGQGGHWLEGYPVRPYSDRMPAAFAWTGLFQAFLDAGFHEAGRHSDARPIMRKKV